MPTSTPSALATRTRAREEVLTAARSCYARDGVRATTMEDVAREAGVSRQLVYKLFLGRRELVEAAVSARTSEIADAIAEEYDVEALRPARELGGIFVAVSVAIIERLRNDEELAALLGPGSPLTWHEALWSDELTARGERFWLPMLEQARAQKLLRADLPVAELSEWLRTVYTSMILRPVLDADDEREVIERFVLTSLSMVIERPRRSSKRLS